MFLVRLVCVTQEIIKKGKSKKKPKMCKVKEITRKRKRGCDNATERAGASIK